jgi:sialate O-acetylesterase
VNVLRIPGPEARSPEFAGMRHVADGRIELTFRHVGQGLRTRDGRNPTHVRLAGADQVFKPASARIAGDKMIVWSTEVPKPVAVRFAWHETAVSNVVNSTDLPMVPFRTDDWPVKTVREK